jgi:uroporphyrinogen-III synthase
MWGTGHGARMECSRSPVAVARALTGHRAASSVRPWRRGRIRLVAFEARRAQELATLFARHGASVTSAPALRESRLPESPAALELVERLERGEVGAVVLLTGVGTRALAALAGDAAPRLLAALAQVPVVARGPKPLAALRELNVSGALPVPAPHTWREALGVLDGVGLATGALVAVQEYGVPPAQLVQEIERRGLRVLRVPVYRWALPEDPGPLERAAAGLVGGAFDVAVFTSAVQVEHLFRVAPDASVLRAALARIVVASIGPVCSEAIEAHGVHPQLEATPPKMGPLVALVAERAPALVHPAGPASPGSSKAPHRPS